MSTTTELAKVADEDIRYRGSNDHAIYIGIGITITVTWMAKWQLFLCLTCDVNECPHTRRVAKWMETHPIPEGF